MNPVIKKLWCDELRSGRHKQCFGRYWEYVEGEVVSCCVVGLLVNLSPKDLATTVHEWAGFGRAGMPLIKYKGQTYGLVDLNDKLNLTFNELADLIEEQY